jgi:hypothetical protein
MKFSFVVFLVLIYTVPLVTDILKAYNKRNQRLKITPLTTEDTAIKRRRRRSAIRSQPEIPMPILPKELFVSDYVGESES